MGSGETTSRHLPFRLDGKVAVVTGGSRGIGRACVQALAKAGASVVFTYQRDEAAAEKTRSSLEDAGGSAEFLRLDVSDRAAVEATFDAIAKRKGAIDVLVSNAGIAIDQLLLRVSEEDVDRTWATNVNGAIWCAKAAIRSMMKKRQGRIIHLSSVVAESGNPGQAVYASSKAALIGLTKTLAREYASRNITVNCVAPGFIETEMTSRLSDELKDRIVGQTPLGRMGTAEDVASTVLFLASEESAFITGQVVRVNGGLYV